MHTITTYRVVSVIFAALTLGATSSRAAKIFADDFTSGGTGAWYKGDLTAGTLANLGGVGGALDFGSGGSNGQDVIGRSFPAATLAVGETLRLTFDYQIDAKEGKIFRVGLYDTANEISANGFTDGGNSSMVGNYDGYTSFLRDSSSSASVARFQDETLIYQTQYWPTSSGSEIGTTATQYNMVNGTRYSVVFDITKTSATQTDTLLTFNSSDGSSTHMSLAGSTTTLIQDSFDAVFIRTGTSDATIDNVSLEVLGETVVVEAEPVTMSLSILDASSVEISWGATNGLNYKVEVCMDLLSEPAGWNEVASGIPGINGELSITNAIDNDQLFFRVITEE